MTDMELNIALREMARSCGLCDSWYKKWSDNSTIDECLERYVRGFDFAVSNNYPPLPFIRKHLADKGINAHGIYLDEDKMSMNVESGTYIFLGNCHGSVTIEGPKVVTMYVRHDSAFDIILKDGAVAFVTCYDNAKVNVEKDEASRCHFYQYQY